MQQIARRYIAATAVLTAGGLIAAAVSSVTPSLPDVQVRDFDLAASLQANLDSPIETVENHFQPELNGTGDLGQPNINLGDLLFDRGDDTFNGITAPTFNLSDLTLDQDLASSLLGGGVAEALRDGLVVDPGTAGVNGFDGVSPGGLFGGNGPDTGNAANTAATAAFSILQGLPAAYQGFTTGLAAAELGYNQALLDAQEAAAERLSGGDSSTDNAINWIFNINNMTLAHNEDALNQLLGVGLSTTDIQGSLLNGFDPEALSQAGWSEFLGLTAGDFTAVANAADTGNLLLLFGGIDWPSIFPGIF